MFPYMIFLLWFFSKLSLSVLLFLILSWLKITTVDFLIKHYRLLQCFPAYFFSFRFFIFSKIIFVDFFKYWTGWELQLYISSQNIIDCYNVFLNDFNIELVENLTLTFSTCFFLIVFIFFFAFFFPKLSSFFFSFFCVYFSELFLLILFF